MKVVYAENVVSHMFIGKAISRTIRAHILLYGILQGIILARVYDVSLRNAQVETKQAEDRDESTRNVGPETSANAKYYEVQNSGTTQEFSLSEVLYKNYYHLWRNRSQRQIQTKITLGQPSSSDETLNCAC